MTPTTRKPLPRKRAKARTWKSPRCDTRGCKKKSEVEWTDMPERVTADYYLYNGEFDKAFPRRRACQSHARAEALRRWSLSIRTGRCELQAFHARYNVRCAGPNVAGHGFGRGAYPSVMFEPWNGFSKCSGLNAWVEDHVLEWDLYLREAWGDKYEERRAQALAVRKYDLGEVLASLSKYAA